MNWIIRRRAWIWFGRARSPTSRHTNFSAGYHLSCRDIAGNPGHSVEENQPFSSVAEFNYRGDALARCRLMEAEPCMLALGKEATCRAAYAAEKTGLQH